MSSNASEHSAAVEPTKRLVEVIVDREKKRVRSGRYLVSDFKKAVGVPADKDLDEIIGGSIKHLEDDEHISIEGGEVFISHERTGGAS